jgi:hypothetical protein
VRLLAGFTDEDEAVGGDAFFDLRLIVNWDFSVFAELGSDAMASAATSVVPP